MRYISGCRRRDAFRKDAGGTPDPRAGEGERILFLTGILALALTLAVPVSRTERSVPDRTPDPRAAVAVMSTAAEDVSDSSEEEAVSARADPSVFDCVGRFFARLITGG